jgi:hypothetical protein
MQIVDVAPPPGMRVAIGANKTQNFIMLVDGNIDNLAAGWLDKSLRPHAQTVGFNRSREIGRLKDQSIGTPPTLNMYLGNHGNICWRRGSIF